MCKGTASAADAQASLSEIGASACLAATPQEPRLQVRTKIARPSFSPRELASLFAQRAGRFSLGGPAKSLLRDRLPSGGRRQANRGGSSLLRPSAAPLISLPRASQKRKACQSSRTRRPKEESDPGYDDECAVETRRRKSTAKDGSWLRRNADEGSRMRET
ncbi:unnamed protein product [Diplocarpon coronariae]|nr:hypothetical protein JHW43_007202 [Diplocarpon mali]